LASIIFQKHSAELERRGIQGFIIDKLFSEFKDENLYKSSRHIN